MSMLLIIILIAIVSTLNIVCFFIGAKVGQTVSKGEKVELPEVNPMQIIRNKADRKEADKEQERINTILHNIENYNGTEYGQKDIP